MTPTPITLEYFGDPGHQLPYFQIPPFGAYLRACRRCDGTGTYKHDGITDVCYRCDGGKTDPDSDIYASEKEALDDANRRGRARARRATQRQTEFQSRLARMQEKQHTLGMEHPDVFAYLAEKHHVLQRAARDDAAPDDIIDGERVPKFIRHMVEELFTPARSDREFTGKMVAAVKIHMDNVPDVGDLEVIEGRIRIEGTIASTKYYEDQYGKQSRMLVLDDRGFKIYGTIPKNIRPNWRWDDESRDYIPDGVLRGSRVRFEASVEQSPDDPFFGFFKRPTKAEILRRQK